MNETVEAYQKTGTDMFEGEYKLGTENTMTITKRNYVLVDYENTQAIEPEKLTGLPVKLVIFVGKNQTSIPVELVKRLCQCQCAMDIYESAGVGKNALDFQVAFYAGRVFEKEPEACIHIVSHDKGFDPLVEHIRKQKRCCSRVDSFQVLPFLNQAMGTKNKVDFKAFTQTQLVDIAVQRLIRMTANARPRKHKTLLSSLRAQFSKQLPDCDIQGIVDVLVKSGYVIIGEKESISYKLQA